MKIEEIEEIVDEMNELFEKMIEKNELELKYMENYNYCDKSHKDIFILYHEAKRFIKKYDRYQEDLEPLQERLWKKMEGGK